MRWLLTWHPADGGAGTACGIDVYTFQDGKIAAEIDYFTI
jgi:hypothetical protein